MSPLFSFVVHAGLKRIAQYCPTNHTTQRDFRRICSLCRAFPAGGNADVARCPAFEEFFLEFCNFHCLFITLFLHTENTQLPRPFSLSCVIQNKSETAVILVETYHLPHRCLAIFPQAPGTVSCWCARTRRTCRTLQSRATSVCFERVRRREGMLGVAGESSGGCTPSTNPSVQVVNTRKTCSTLRRKIFSTIVLANNLDYSSASRFHVFF